MNGNRTPLVVGAKIATGLGTITVLSLSSALIYGGERFVSNGTKSLKYVTFYLTYVGAVGAGTIDCALYEFQNGFYESINNASIIAVASTISSRVGNYTTFEFDPVVVLKENRHYMCVVRNISATPTTIYPRHGYATLSNPQDNTNSSYLREGRVRSTNGGTSFINEPYSQLFYVEFSDGTTNGICPSTVYTRLLNLDNNTSTSGDYISYLIPFNCKVFQVEFSMRGSSALSTTGTVRASITDEDDNLIAISDEDIQPKQQSLQAFYLSFYFSNGVWLQGGKRYRFRIYYTLARDAGGILSYCLHQTNIGVIPLKVAQNAKENYLYQEVSLDNASNEFLAGLLLWLNPDTPYKPPTLISTGA